MKYSRTYVSLAVVTAAMAIALPFVAACSGGTKVEPTAGSSSQPPAATIVVSTSEYAFDVSSTTVAAGRVPITLHNNGAEPHQVMIARLHDGVTVDRYLSAAHSDEGSASSLIDNAGGVNIVDPGTTGTGYGDFAPGSYVLLCYIPAGDGVGHLHHGMVAELTVPASGAAAAVPEPVSIGDVVMQDFNFTLPPQGLAAPGTYRFVNNGSQAHEFVVMRLDDGKTLGDALPYLQAGFKGDKPLTFEGGSGGVEPGHTGFVDLSLTSGQYVAMCFIVDPASHRHHAELGMVAPFTVSTP
jgi:uncharacterized cupredoxin-like copper-binding protein